MPTPELSPALPGARRLPAPAPRVPRTGRHRRTTVPTAAPRPTPRTGRVDSLWWLIAVVAVLACTWLYWDIAQTALAPRTPWDEGHPLQTARWIAGERDLTQVSGSGYYPGWAVLIAPVWWFTDDAYAAYSAAVWIGNVLALATIAPLAAIARRFQVSWPQAIAISAVVMMFPGRSLLADYALSEQPLMLFYALTALAAHRLWEKPSWGRAAALLAAASGAFFIHSRALALLGTVAIWFLCFCLRSWRIGMAGAVGAVVVWQVVGALAEALAETVLLSGYGKEDVLRDGLESASVDLFARVLLNQGWVQALGYLGLTVVGMLIVSLLTVDELRRLRPGIHTFYFGLTTSAFLMSTIWWTRASLLLPPDGGRRFDAWVYSRYLDNIGAILSVIALAYLLRHASARLVGLSALLYVPWAALVVLWVAPSVPVWGSTNGPANASSVLAWAGLFPQEPFAPPLVPTLANENRFWVWATLAVLVALAGLALTLSRPKAMVVLVGIAALSTSLVADPDQTRYPPRNMIATVETVERATGQERMALDFDHSCSPEHGPNRAVALNSVAVWMSPRNPRVVEPRSGDEFTADLVMSCEHWEEAEALGARAVTGRPSYGYRIWVLPGAVQDELAQQGLLDLAA